MCPSNHALANGNQMTPEQQYMYRDLEGRIDGRKRKKQRHFTTLSLPFIIRIGV